MAEKIKKVTLDRITNYSYFIGCYEHHIENGEIRSTKIDVPDRNRKFETLEEAVKSFLEETKWDHIQKLNMSEINDDELSITAVSFAIGNIEWVGTFVKVTVDVRTKADSIPVSEIEKAIK